MSDPAEQMDVDDRPPSEREDAPSASDDESAEIAPADLMVVSRARRSNAGNRMSTLLAKSAEEEEWGEEWEEAANEEEFVGDEANEQDDYNLDSSSSEEGDDDGDEEAGEKEFQKAERQERTKKHKTTTNPFAARLAASSRKRVKLDVPTNQSPAAPPRPKKKSERASWIPTEEDGPIRTSSRRQTVANKETTLAKLKEKDRRRDDTLAMMKAAEARKAKDEPKPLTQAERLTQAARLERINSKSLHRWEELEEQRAAERQAKLDALKNRQIEGPFIRFYSGPATWVDDKIKYMGRDAPTLEQLEEKLNKETPRLASQGTQSGTAEPTGLDHNTQPFNLVDQSQNTQGPPMVSTSQPSGPVQDVSAGSRSMSNPGSIMFAPPEYSNAFLYGMEQYAQPSQQTDQHSQQWPPSQPELPPNPFLQTTQTFSQPYPLYNDPILTQDHNHISPSHLLSQFQNHSQPPAPPQLPRRRTIRRALRNLLILSSFPDLDATPASTRLKTTASLLKEKDRAALIQLSTALFGWSPADAAAFVSTMLNAPKTKKEREALARPRKELCAISNKEARYRDPETGIAYRDSRAFGVLRGVVGGGFVWCGELGCYVGGRAKPMESRGKGFLGTKPAIGVPRRFLEMEKVPKPVVEAKVPDGVANKAGVCGAPVDGVKTEAVAGT
ncbi:YL1-domain-containing protein [Lentithecium fluviatile CBS 122367]|uniref:YL1-domain-containing protein n=1 Tax=Lentithecium fluviatile CBS 122367 TaxID=1168545 RepID=A0A6G1IJ20_9PLEO|nr:YL1-domain-containing protein [Lentithecium fluviatile CBS 122367]